MRIIAHSVVKSKTSMKFKFLFLFVILYYGLVISFAPVKKYRAKEGCEGDNEMDRKRNLISYLVLISLRTEQ